LQKLEDRDYIKIDGNNWAMTKSGYHAAQNLYDQLVNTKEDE